MLSSHIWYKINWRIKLLNWIIHYRRRIEASKNSHFEPKQLLGPQWNKYVDIPATVSTSASILDSSTHSRRECSKLCGEHTCNAKETQGFQGIPFRYKDSLVVLTHIAIWRLSNKQIENLFYYGGKDLHFTLYTGC